MYEKVYVVDCCGFCSYPPPHRPPMRANFRASSSFFLRNFVRTKLVMCLEFSSPANDVSNLTSFDIGYVGMAGSNLHLFQRFLGTKVGRMATSRFPVLRRVEARTAERRLVTFRGSSGSSPKAGPTQRRVDEEELELATTHFGALRNAL